MLICQVQKCLKRVKVTLYLLQSSISMLFPEGDCRQQFEMNYQSCPDRRTDCSNNSVSVFWNTVSKRFAEDACGVVHVLLNGSVHNTFDERSTFARVEVFNLHPEKVHTLQAWVMQDIRNISSDSCSDASIKNLKLILSKRNITFTCENNYRPIRFLQCVKYPEHSSCRSKI
ncbi:adp-ribosyl cyclase 1 [Lynx pardinus]|uniref:ADP-ribosyl cyclase/cyclic ADP-ribose hydrolase 1 n=1 Tax=Lynx pardinus TaxID=191816 RepID=A0A485NCR7_LYNPA|nr:adp-ribosyl cyclase 1 [Lynx pardinus]